MSSPDPDAHALVITHEGYEDAGAIAPALARAGLRTRVVHREHLSSGEQLTHAKFVLSMGSLWHPLPGPERSAITRERRLLDRAVTAGIATVGVCFGAQLLAANAGGEIARLDAPLSGWHDISLELPDRSAPRSRVFCWNQCGFGFPPAGRSLAAKDGACLAFRAGPALGVQFHLDADASVLKRWIADEHAGPRRRAMTTAWVDAERDALASNQRLADLLVADALARTGVAVTR